MNHLALVSSVLFLALMLSGATAQAQSGWYWQNPLPQGNHLHGVDFIDAETGVAVGAGGTILRTTDGGRHWTMQASGCLQTLFKVCWSDANTVTAVAPNGAILRSTDRGVSWETRLYGGGPFSLSDVAFADQYNGFAVGTRTLLKTCDGGRSWEARVCPSSKWLASISFCDSVTGLIVEGDGNVFFTTDAGETWIPKSTGARFFYSGTLVSKNTAIAVGTNGTIVRTTDGGDTWVKERPFTNDAFWNVDFVDSSTGYIVGEYGLILKTTDGGDQWTLQSSNCTDFLHGVSVIHPDHACTVGTNGTLLYSGDGGLTWERQSGAINWGLYSVSFPNKTLGVAVGCSSVSTGGREGLVLRTTDAGANWTSALLVPDHLLYGVSLVNESSGTAVGDKGIILHTTDGGLTWTQQLSAAITRFNAVQQIDPVTATAVGYWGQVYRSVNGMTWSSQFAGEGDFFGVSFSSLRNGCIVGDKARIYITTNGGTTWQQKDLGPSGRGAVFRGVSFIDSTTGYIVGNGGVIFKTTDGGTTFINKSIGWGVRDLNAVTCIDARTAVAVGEGLIIRTTDGGDRWVEQTGAGFERPMNDSGAIMQELYSVCFIGSDFGTIVGDGGTIIHTSTGGVVAVRDAPHSPSNIYLSQNFPNPIGSSGPAHTRITSIPFTLSSSGYTTLRIYDILGQERATLIDGFLPPGDHIAKWNATGFSPGVYFYRLETPRGVEARKMVLMR